MALDSGCEALPCSNIASGEAASVAGGFENKASGIEASVSGGTINWAEGTHSAILGGAGFVLTGLDYRSPE